MSINIGVPERTTKLVPRVIVMGIGGGGCNALNCSSDCSESYCDGVGGGTATCCNATGCLSDLNCSSHCSSSYCAGVGGGTATCCDASGCMSDLDCDTSCSKTSV